MDYALIAYLFLGFSVVMYVVLDGFDLGIGILLPFARDAQARELMIASVAPVWDGNETWLVLGGVLLFAAFPVAYGILLMAWYVPISLMLVALVLRGVAFEYRPEAKWKGLWTTSLSAGSLLAAYAIGVWYMVHHAPLLWPIAIAEGFFVLAYNLEWFGGRFHRDSWFAFSWGALPVLAGYVLQANALSAGALLVAAAMAALSLVEIKASRPYKALKRAGAAGAEVERLEAILKCLSLGVIALGAGMAAWRLWG